MHYFETVIIILSCNVVNHQNLARSSRQQTVLFTAPGREFHNLMESIGFQYPESSGYEQLARQRKVSIVYDL